MSVEDLEPDFLSDEADDDDNEAERNDGEQDDDDVAVFAELLHLYHNMMRFDHIHINGVMLDMMNESESENSSGFYHHWVEDMMSAFSSVMSPENWSTSDSDDISQRYAPFYEDTFSSCSFSSDSANGWTANGTFEATNWTPDGAGAGSAAGSAAGSGSGSGAGSGSGSGAETGARATEQ